MVCKAEAKYAQNRDAALSPFSNDSQATGIETW